MMLWYKGWLETRIKLLFALGITGFLLFRFHFVHFTEAGRSRQAAILAIVGITMPSAIAAISILLAGAGINTQAPFQATKGLHGSTLYTLSLPVSRLRLLAVRAAFGWLEGVGATAVLGVGMWLEIPLMRAMATRVEMFEYAATAVVCGSVMYFLSVLLGTFLDDVWRVWGTLIAFVAMAWVSSQGMLPRFTDIFQAMGKGSPPIVHAMPWEQMGFAVAASAVLFVAALKVAQAREY